MRDSREVRTFAQLLGCDDRSATMQHALLEERESDASLTALALTVNVDASVGEPSDIGSIKR